ncbi:MAG: hypothetical protein K8E66_10820, partial [Phycisphaerales bacterium]|nr:hypothetical protein [Phycisphaerales bacterium]
YQWEVLETGGKKVCLTFLGDGAIDQGAFHEAKNLASVFGIPVIYVIENNGYSMGTAIERHTANHDKLTMRGEAYGIKSIEIEGLDIRNVYDHMKPLVDECRDLQRPGFVDLKTYRYQGHSMSDPQKYRTKDEVAEFKEQDSIANLAAHLMETEAEGGRGCLTEADWKAMQKQIRGIVMDAVAFAENAADPDPARELATDTYALPMKNLSPSEEYSHGAKNPLL